MTVEFTSATAATAAAASWQQQQQEQQQDAIMSVTAAAAAAVNGVAAFGKLVASSTSTTGLLTPFYLTHEHTVDQHKPIVLV
jgi:hypothetical protein